MLPDFSTEQRESPWQPKLCKNKPKFRRIQFSKSYGDNVCVYGRVFVVGEFKYANKNFRRAKGVAIHVFADDTQFYRHCLRDEMSATVVQLATALADISRWMFASRFALNPDKTELLWASSKYIRTLSWRRTMFACSA